MDDAEHYARIGASRAVPDRRRAPVNPYFITLWVVLGLCVVIGFILITVGNSLAAHAFEPGAGLAQIIWGGALLGLAVTTAIVMLGAAAARW